MGDSSSFGRHRITYKALSGVFTAVIGSACIPAIKSQEFYWIILWVFGLSIATFSNIWLIMLDERSRQDMLRNQIASQAVKINLLQKREVDIRHVLVGVRNLVVARTHAIDELLHQELNSLGYAGIVGMAYSALGFDEVMQKIMTAIFNVYSGGNQDLERRFSVSFMTVCDDELKIKDWENTDRVVPETMSKDDGFKKGEGCAGAAWLYQTDIYEPDTENPKCFVSKTERHKRDIKSMLSVPVIHRSKHEGAVFLGVLNIDTTVKEFFEDTEQCRKEVSIKLKPYIYLIALAHRGKQLIDELMQLQEGGPNG